MSDTTLRRVLTRIEASYVEPGRIVPEQMLISALRSVSVSPESGLLDRIGSGGGLSSRLAPALEQALAAQGSEGPGLRLARLLTGAVRALDPYSRAVSGAARVRMLVRYSGSASGIGVRIGRREGRIRILRCYKGGAASAAGLQAGDEIAAVDGRPTDGKVVAEVLRELRGPRGTAVTVGLHRLPPVELVVERRPFIRSSITTGISQDGIAVLRLARLSKTTPAEVARWFAALTQPGGLTGLILDLRGNRGGSMLAAAAIADRFVGEGLLVEALDRSGRPVPGLTSRIEATEGKKPAWPIAILLDEKTSSAAELLAAALAWNDRAILVGRRSFGKQTVMKLYHYPDDDLTLRLAVAYMRASGRSLSLDGLEPDLWVAPGEIDRPQTLEVARRAIREHGRTSRSDWLARCSSE